MFSKQTYINRRQELKKLVGSGVVILSETMKALPTSRQTDTIRSVRTPRSSTISDSSATVSLAL